MIKILKGGYRSNIGCEVEWIIKLCNASQILHE